MSLLLLLTGTASAPITSTKGYAVASDASANASTASNAAASASTASDA